MKVAVEQWQHYTLKSASGRAMAYLTHAQTKGLGPIAQAQAGETAQALEAVREDLAQMEADRTEDAPRKLHIPATREFTYALGALDVSPAIQSMMRALALTDEGGITATALADVAGYANYNAANLQLGMACAQMGDMTGLRTAKGKDAEGRAAATFLIADEGPREAATGNWTWRPRPAFAAAFKAIQGS